MLAECGGADESDAAVDGEADDDGQVGDGAADGDRDRLHHVTVVVARFTGHQQPTSHVRTFTHTHTHTQGNDASRTPPRHEKLVQSV